MDQNYNGDYEGFKKPNIFQRFLNYISKFGAPLTTLIILLNLIMFLFLTIDGGSENLNTLARWGASINAHIYTGELWRLLTSIFLHGGFIHLFVNMYSLYNLGNVTERVFGQARFVLIYIASGLFGNLVSVLFTPAASRIVSVGASGAIFGLAGAILYLGMRSPQFFKKIAGTRFLVVILANLVVGYMIPYIDNLAHIGGLIGGFLVSWAVGLSNDVPDNMTKFLRIFLILLTLGCLGKIIFTTPIF